jgi:Protein of unknown function (DUF3089)
MVGSFRASLTFLIGLVCAGWGGTAMSPALAATKAEALSTPVWLCKPGAASNLCNQDERGNAQGAVGQARYPSGAKAPLNATVITNTRANTTEPFKAHPSPEVDCFYVYPTVDVLPNPLLSNGATPPRAQAAQAAMLLAQVGLLTGQCRVFAPLYRQSTLLQIAQSISDGAAPYPGPGFADVQQAWDTYWAKDNIDPSTGKRRGVILLGHSQGSVALAELLTNRFDGNSATSAQLISALLIGGRVMVPMGQRSGGGQDPDSTLQHLPLCQRLPGEALPTGCIIAYSAFAQPSGAPPVSGNMGESKVPGHQIACVNPAALLLVKGDADPSPLDAYMPTQKLVQGNALNPNGKLSVILSGFKLPAYPTGYVRYPSRLTATCMTASTPESNTSWLQVDGGQNMFPASTGTSALGLHVFDYNIALGTLRDLLSAQAAAWLQQR